MAFLNEGTFILTSSVQEVKVLSKRNNLQSLGKALVKISIEACTLYETFLLSELA